MAVPVILAAIRTPFGKRGGAFRDTRPDSLLAHALKGVVARAGVDPSRIEDVVCGTVTQAGEQGANIGRLGVLLAGFPVEVPAVSLNRMCGSSQQAVHFAAQAIAAGDARYAIGCGVENMTRVRMFSDIDPDGRHGGFGGLNPELLSRHELIHQGESAERVAERWRLSRQALDEFSIESHARARRAPAGGQARSWPPRVSTNQAVRSCSGGTRACASASTRRGWRASNRSSASRAAWSPPATRARSPMARRPSWWPRRARAYATGSSPRARFLARVVVGASPTLQLDGVIPATRRRSSARAFRSRIIDWIEVNEAFACVPLAWPARVRRGPGEVNPWGGAIAHGHPLGATGAGLMAKMLAGLEATGGTLGLQTMCIGHGMATATIIERI